MLRITLIPESGATRLKLEGKLAGAWVAELENAWAGLRGSRVVVDLHAVTFIAPEGRQLLEKICREGADFWTDGVLNRSIVEQARKCQ